ncbi:MAG: EF-hand domain-containing protein [Desulfovibrionales bacterium]
MRAFFNCRYLLLILFLVAGPVPAHAQLEEIDPIGDFQRMDENNNGIISWEEFKESGEIEGQEVPDERRMKVFQIIDTDNNGFITLEEWERAEPTVRDRRYVKETPETMEEFMEQREEGYPFGGESEPES